MELRKLGNQHKKQRCKVDSKVIEVILCVETCEEEQNNRYYGDKLARCGELLSVVNLFPSCHAPSLSLVQQLPWCSFYLMQEQVVCQIMNDIG